MADKVGLDTECFFIAPIGDEGSPVRKRSDGVLKYIVGHAATELGLTAVRGDEISEPGMITRQVLDHVLGAKTAVADLTDLNANVFYEMAVRHAAKLPVVLIAEIGVVLPFDIAPMRTIFVDHTDLESADKCRTEIVKQLREAIENGAVDSPISASLDVQALQGGSAVERNVAELVTAFESVSKGQTRMATMIDRLVQRQPQLRRYDSIWARFVDLMRYVKLNYPTDERLNVRVDRLGVVIGNFSGSRSGSAALIDDWLAALDETSGKDSDLEDIHSVGVSRSTTWAVEASPDKVARDEDHPSGV